MEKKSLKIVDGKPAVSTKQKFTAEPYYSNSQWLQIETDIRRFHGFSGGPGPSGLKYSFLYFFTVTPKGTKVRFSEYLGQFAEACYSLKVINWLYYTRERTVTNHLHGIVSCKTPGYKFRKLTTSRFTFRATALESLRKGCRYMTKESPSHYYFLRYSETNKVIYCDNSIGGIAIDRSKDVVIKKTFLKIKLK